jgi:IMP dehydrogenase
MGILSMKIHSLLSEKSRTVQTIAVDNSIESAIDLMVARRTSALIVTDKDQPVGIFAESDIFRFWSKNKSSDFSETILPSAMTAKLITAKPEDDIEQILPVMLKAGVSHLPVIENQKVVGMLHLTDIFENRIESLSEELHYLNDYIEDLHEAGRD